MPAAAFALAYAGFLALCLSMDRHHRDIFTRQPAPARRLALKGIGWLLLALSGWLSVLRWGWAEGPVGWLGLLTSAALLLVFLLPYAPRAALLLGPGLPILGGLAAALSFIA